MNELLKSFNLMADVFRVTTVPRTYRGDLVDDKLDEHDDIYMLKCMQLSSILAARLNDNMRSTRGSSMKQRQLDGSELVVFSENVLQLADALCRSFHTLQDGVRAFQRQMKNFENDTMFQLACGALKQQTKHFEDTYVFFEKRFLAEGQKHANQVTHTITSLISASES